MTLSDQARQRLADLVELQPTKNKELQDRWGLDSGSDVHAYLESELGDYYYRDDDSLIRATPAAARLVDGTQSSITITPLQDAVLTVLPGPDEDPISVVATLHRLDDDSVSVDAVRRALRGLVDRGLAEDIHRTVPTYRLAAPRTDFDITVRDTTDTTHQPATDADDREDPTPSRRGT